MDVSLKYPPTPEHAADLAALIVPVALKVSNVVLDYSPPSLSEVDRILGGFYDDSVAVDTIGPTLFSFGCYVGEVFVRNLGGSWRLTAETSMAKLAGWPIIVQTGTDSFVNPIGKVFKRVQNGPEDDLCYFYKVFSEPE